MLNKKYIFFRDDDVYKLDKSFSNIFNLFLKSNIPIVYGLIPNKIERDLSRFLLENKKRCPRLLDIAQHGWTHQNYNCDNSVEKYEFGLKRSYRKQKMDIIKGWLKLYELFKDEFSPTFIPSYHAYDFKTLKIINELGERKNLYVFSAGKKTIPKNKNFLDMPAEVSFNPPKYKNEGYLNIFLKGLFNKLRSNSIVGILLHHKDFNTKEILLLKKLLKILKKNKNIKFILLSELIKNRKLSKIDITLEITNDCNLKCKICNIWREKPKRYLLVNDIKKMFYALSEKYSLGSVSLTGGEPFLNPQTEEIYRFFCEQKLNNKIDSIGIYTNGYATKLILNFLKNNSSLLAGLDMGISIDGREANHNFLRGKPDAFKNSVDLIDRILSDYPQVKLAAKFTITAINFKDLLSIYRWCREKKILLIAKFIEFDSRFYYHKAKLPLAFNTSFSLKDKKILKNTLLRIYRTELRNIKRVVDLSIIKALISFTDKGDKIVNECYTPMYSLFINPNGDIHPCLYMPAITNLKNKGWINELMGINHLNIIEKGINNTCPKCFAFHGFLKNVNMAHLL